MLKVTDKYIFIGRENLATGLILSPFVVMHVFTTFVWWQILVFYLMAVIPPLIGLSIHFNNSGNVEIKREATTKH